MPTPQSPYSDLLDFLGSAPLFEGLVPEHLRAIAGITQQQSYQKGEILFHQGDESCGFYLIQCGRIKVFRLATNGREQILHIFGPGEHFAEVPAFDGHCFTASGAALEPTASLFFPRSQFLDLLEKNPKLTINLLKSFARHTRRFSNLVDTLSLHEVPGRLAIYLLQLSDRNHQADQFELDLNKTQLAAMLGTIPETLSRVFYKLSQAGILVVEGSTIVVRDRDQLQQLAQ